ncbi:SDR family oxidoreductase [Streptomyces sp. NBC_00841]|uniref:SDR family NAD(P)-dependent oxidoreductase n=1 Tax=Streptomyces sp. NBC_00841 TaxID=2975847 RepID=UPI002DD9CA8C|nr:SDR family NAD(P)-dependent oxidoreductase [Streptomyces sp. NBC_00841]WRZ96855.1 SDR family oxidoreductase [Streptomyces sp. NBC_00841]
MARFSGRKVLITGAGSGIGREMTRLFLEEGASVIGADLDPSNVPAGAHQFKVDTSSEDDVAQLFTAARDTLGGVDILCNNAGIGSTTSVLDATVAEWDRVFAVNVRGTFLCTKYALPYMLDQKAGVIVNTASVAGMIGLADRASYAASKGAVIALTKQVAVQWAKDGIRCNCVCPGTVDSPWVGRLLEQSDDPQRRRAELVARQPLGRLAQPVEIAKAAVYLASDDAAFVTGTEFVIDGGILAG